ncbi:hypothetical protein Tco_1141785 [Tanacetum coccineum]
MSRANPQAAIVSEEQLVPRANRLTIKKNNQRVALDSDITDTLLRLIVGILRHHKLYKPVSLTATHDTSTTSTRGIKVSKLNLLRNQKSNMCLQSEVEEEKVICVQLTIVEEPVAVELANSISIEEQRHQQRPTIEASAVQSLLDLRKGSKVIRLESLRQEKQPVAEEGSSAAHNKYYESEDILATDNDATQDSSCSDTDEEKEDETYASDDSDMDLSADEPQGDDDAAGYGVFMYNKSTKPLKSTYISPTVTSSSLDYIQSLLNETHVHELTNLMSNPVYIDAYKTSVVANPKGNYEITSYKSGASKVPFGTHVDVQATNLNALQAKAKKLMQKAKKKIRKIKFKKAVAQKFKEYD